MSHNKKSRLLGSFSKVRLLVLFIIRPKLTLFKNIIKFSISFYGIEIFANEFIYFFISLQLLFNTKNKNKRYIYLFFQEKKETDKTFLILI